MSGAPAAGLPVVRYCERWDRVGHDPSFPLTEEQARDRFEHGPWFTVVVPVSLPEGATVVSSSARVAATPDVVLEIEAGITTVTAVFFDHETGGVVAEYVFRRHGDALLLAEGLHFEAPDDGRIGWSAVTRTRQLWVQVDGTVDLVVDERGGDGLHVVDDGSVDVTTYWEPVPAFGDWAGLARYEW